MPDWEHPDTVAFFRARDPDLRVQELVANGDVVAGTRVLDLGCAAGRNAVFLATHGFQGVAIDGSGAMVAATRERLVPFAATAPWLVLQRPLHALDDLGDGAFGLLLALGILQNAPSDALFEGALDHLARLAAPGARLLIQNFGPDSRPYGRPLEHVPGSAHVWRGFRRDDHTAGYALPDADALDAMVTARGFALARPTRVVWKATDEGERTTIVAEYLAHAGSPATPRTARRRA